MTGVGAVSLEEALGRLLPVLPGPGAREEVPLQEGVGRVLAGAVTAAVSYPPFDRSPLDGYAFDHRDVRDAGAEQPATLKVVGVIHAGDGPGEALTRGQAARIMTGAPLPQGASCVVRQEMVRGEGDMIWITAPLEPGENICRRGEDLEEGRPLLARGTRLGAAHLGVLASQGQNRIAVYPRPAIGVLSTGDELAEAGAPLGPGQVYDCNGAALAGRVLEMGALPLGPQRVADRPQAFAEAVEVLWRDCDLVLSTGGVSVGDRDCVPRACELLGAEPLFRRVTVRPGGWTLAVRRCGKVVLCLSGNPFAATAVFELLGAPLLRRLAGEEPVEPRRVRGRLETPFPKESPSRRLIRARIEGGAVSLPDNHHTGSLVSLMGCNCLVDLPAGTPPLEKGDRVEAVLL